MPKLLGTWNLDIDDMTRTRSMSCLSWRYISDDRNAPYQIKVIGTVEQQPRFYSRSGYSTFVCERLQLLGDSSGKLDLYVQVFGGGRLRLTVVPRILWRTVFATLPPSTNVCTRIRRSKWIQQLYKYRTIGRVCTRNTRVAIGSCIKHLSWSAACGQLPAVC